MNRLWVIGDSKKVLFPGKSVFIFLFSYFCTLFSKKLPFCYSTTFFESLITHKRFVFKESYISYGKRQKSCTLIVIWVKCLYLTYPTFNSSAKSNRLFFIAKEEVVTLKSIIVVCRCRLLVIIFYFVISVLVFSTVLYIRDGNPVPRTVQIKAKTSYCAHSQQGTGCHWKQNLVVEKGLDMKRGVAWFFIIRVQGAEACPEPNIYDSFFIKWFTK